MPLPTEKNLVYIVDDTSTLRTLVGLMLSQMGCRSVAFESAEKCLAALETEQPDLILMDLEMPGMRGDECCRRIKERPQWSAIPIVMMTGQDASPDVMQSWRAGADDFLPKPMKHPQLEAKVKGVLAAAGAAFTPPRRSRQRLLFVDDTLFFRQVLGGALEHAGFQLLYARNGAEALTLIEAHAGSIDGCVVDLVMPGLNGIGVVRRLKEDARMAGKPVLVVSAEGQPDSAIAAEVLRLTGQPVLDRRALPIDLIVAKVNSALQRVAVDLRVGERIPFFSVVSFRGGPAEEWMSGFTYDVSSGGLFVRTLTPSPSGTSIELSLSFCGRKPAPVSRALVAWSNPYRRRSTFSYPVGMGLQFTELDSQESAFLARLVKQRPGAVDRAARPGAMAAPQLGLG